MKGYSFQELVKLAEAAVKRAGDTMTGNLTAPKVLVSGAQGTEVNALTRYDYFTSQLPKRATEIPGDADLNTYQTAGFYYQDSDADASNGSNYPIAAAGSLTVLKAAGVTQEYRVYSQSLTYRRGYYNGAWSAWQKVYDAGNKPTAAEVGALPYANEEVTSPVRFKSLSGLFTAGSWQPIEMGHLQGTPGTFHIDIHTDGTVGAQDFRYRWSYFDDLSYGALFSGNLKVDGHIHGHGGVIAGYGNIGQISINGDYATSSIAFLYAGLNRFVTQLDASGHLATHRYDILTGAYMSTPHIIYSSGVTSMQDPRSHGPQGAAADALTRKDYVDGEIAKKVSKSGDTMTGNLTTPKVLVSDAQGTEANALTRRDYVTAELAKKLNLTGGTLTGNLTAPTVLVSSAQNTSVNALTRKDYVDSAIAAGDALQVSKSGDTMTGPLTIASPNAGLVLNPSGTPASYIIGLINDVNNWFVGKGSASNDDITLQSYRHNTSVNLQSDRITVNKNILVDASQSLAANAYTRKDYVDAELAKKLNLTGGTLTGNLTAPAVLVSSAQNTSANALTRKDYVDSAIAAGDALQVSKSGDTMTGNLFAPAVLVSSAQNASPNALTRKDYVDGQVTTRAPTTHTHTAAQGNADIVASGYGQIGTYAMLKSLSSSNLGPGSTLEGNSLQYVSCSGKDNYAAPSPGGTWKCLGIANSFKNSEGSGATLWVRIA